MGGGVPGAQGTQQPGTGKFGGIASQGAAGSNPFQQFQAGQGLQQVGQQTQQQQPFQSTFQQGGQQPDYAALFRNFAGMFGGQQQGAPINNYKPVQSANDFQLRNTYQFSPATDPSRQYADRVKAEADQRAADDAAKAATGAAAPQDNYTDPGSPGNARGGRINGGDKKIRAALLTAKGVQAKAVPGKSEGGDVTSGDNFKSNPLSKLNNGISAVALKSYLDHHNIPFTVKNSQNFSNTHGPSASSYYIIPAPLGPHTIRLSDHDYIDAENQTDLRYGMDPSDAELRLADSLGLPLSERAAQRKKEKESQATAKKLRDQQMGLREFIDHPKLGRGQIIGYTDKMTNVSFADRSAEFPNEFIHKLRHAGMPLTTAEGVQAKAVPSSHGIDNVHTVIDPATVDHPAADIPGIHLRAGRMGKDGGGALVAPGAPAPEEEDSITAYHGSPHSFEQFDPKYIGTGEGNQAYGHGLYFAKNEDIAKGYRDNLSPGKLGRVKIGDEEHPYWATRDVINAYVKKGYSKEAAMMATIALQEHKGDPINAGATFWDNDHPEADKAGEALVNTALTESAGHMYEVRLKAKPEHFLDWDKPLSDQHPHVIAALQMNRELPRNTGLNTDKTYSKTLGHFVASDTTGKDVVYGNPDAKNLSERLSAAGIRGIRYLDAGSRSQGDGTHNYVVFDPKHIEVVRKYERGGEVEGEAEPQPQFSVSNPMPIFPKPQRMWDDQRPGGAYLSMPDKADVTGHRAAQAEIGVKAGGKPFFNASRDAVEATGTPGRGSAIVKTNLFKKKAGWQWAQAPEGHEATDTIVSVDHRGKHHYALNVQFPKGVDLSRYEKATSEPRLRPTTKGNLEFGEQAGTILVRGKEHPVYHNVTVRSSGGRVGYAGGGGEDDPQALRNGGSPDDDRYREYMKRILSPSNPDLLELARQVNEGYKVGDYDYSGFKAHPVLPSAVKTTIGPLGNAAPKEATPLTWEQFSKIGKGGTLFTLGGDRSNLGRLTHVNGKKLAWPVDLHAGTKYQQEPNPGVVWANDKNAAKALRSNIMRAAEKGPVYGAFAPMGPQSVDSSRNMIDVLISQIAAGKVDEKAAKEFDDLLREGIHVHRIASTDKEKKRLTAAEKMQEWPGILSKEKARDFAVSKMTGTERAALVKLMDGKKWLQAGFPSISTTRAAITDPDVMHVSGNMIGGNIVELDPRRVAKDELAFEHSTYNTPTAGKLIGRVPFVERHAATPDFTQEQVTADYSTKAGDPLLIHPYSPNPGGRAAYRGNTEMRQAIQPINNRMLESIQEREEQKKLYGFKEGGVVDKALQLTRKART